MPTVTLPNKSAIDTPRHWHELTCEVETAQEIKISVTFFAERDSSTGRFQLMKAEINSVELRLGGCRVPLPVDDVKSAADRDAILREAGVSWDRVEPLFIQQWESENEFWGDFPE